MTQTEKFLNFPVARSIHRDGARTLCVYEDYNPVARRISDELAILGSQLPGIHVPVQPRIYRVALCRPRSRIRADAKLANKLGAPEIVVTRRGRRSNPRNGVKHYTGLVPSPAVRVPIFGKGTAPTTLFQVAKQALIPCGTPMAYPLGVKVYPRLGWDPWGVQFTRKRNWDAGLINTHASQLFREDGKCVLEGPDSDFKRFYWILGFRDLDPLFPLAWFAEENGGPFFGESAMTLKEYEEQEEWEELE
jgi:hypothetical protein